MPVLRQAADVSGKAKRHHNTMDILSITKLYTIFNSKRWTDNDGNEIVFENFCKLLTNLTDAQRDLIIELAERYTWITFSEYSSKLINTLNSVDIAKLNSFKRIYLFPIMRPEDEKKTKSGHTVLYMLRAMKPLLTNYKHIKFIEFETFESFKEGEFTVSHDEAIFLLDDYLGSGETINATVTEILKNKDIQTNNLNVISIASQKETYDSVIALGISMYTNHISLKGITDYYTTPILEEKQKIMLEIEKLIPGNHFSFGYNNSEALITLMRTPDNTFPIFWKEYKKNGEKYEAPFSRY